MEFTVRDAVAGVAGVNQCSGYEEYTIHSFKVGNALAVNGLRGYNTTYTSTVNGCSGCTFCLLRLFTSNMVTHRNGAWLDCNDQWRHFLSFEVIAG